MYISLTMSYHINRPVTVLVTWHGVFNNKITLKQSYLVHVAGHRYISLLKPKQTGPNSQKGSGKDNPKMEVG